MIKVISFDIGGTLIEDNNDTFDKYNLKSLAKLVNLDYNNVRLVYKDIFQKTKGTFDELVDNFCNKLNIEKTDELIDFFNNKFNSNTSSISTDKIEFIKFLKSLGYKIILFSNACCLNDNSLDNDLLYYIDKVYYSFDLGYTKNDKESYRYIESDLNYNSKEFLHIGDTLKADYFCPIENGWNALYYGKSDDSNIKSINSINDIYDYLKKDIYLFDLKNN